MKPKELAGLLQVMREHGATRLRVKSRGVEYEVDLGPKPLAGLVAGPRTAPVDQRNPGLPVVPPELAAAGITPEQFANLTAHLG